MSTDIATTTGLGAYSNIFTCLDSRDSIYIQQMGTGRECVEMITGCEISNRFEIKAGFDSPPFFRLKEDSNFIVRQCCKGIYPFDMKLTLPESEEPQILFRRDFHCTNVNNLCPCCWMCNPCAADCAFGRQVLDVMTVDNQLLGRVKEEPRAWCGLTNWAYYDEVGQPKFNIQIPCCEMCKMCCCNDVIFECTRYGNDEVIATLTRKCVCDVVNVATDKDHFELIYKPEAKLNAMEKFCLVTTVIMVKYMHFEQQE